jgi:hypothetical protein
VTASTVAKRWRATDRIGDFSGDATLNNSLAKPMAVIPLKPSIIS